MCDMTAARPSRPLELNGILCFVRVIAGELVLQTCIPATSPVPRRRIRLPQSDANSDP